MTHHDLPLPDYDSLPTGAIESRVRTLDEPGVRRLLNYEREHADRPLVVRILEQRLTALHTGDAEPSGGSPASRTPETGSAPGPAQPPMTEGPPINPPSQGVPTNPSQPRG